MRFRVAGADGVWVTYRGSDTSTLHKTEWIDVKLPPTTYDAQQVQHVCLTFLRRDDSRYTLSGGGLVLAIGIPGCTGLGPSKALKDDTAFDNEDRVFATEFVPELITKPFESIQWHDGKVTPVKNTVLSVEYGTDWLYRVWDVSGAYRRISSAIVHDIAQRANTVFRRNPAHWGKDERGFVRMSELRASFPSIAMPGCCIEECCANRISSATFDKLVAMARIMCNTTLSSIPLSANDVLDTSNHAMHNTLEALTCAVLALSGVHVGYDAELIDDTSVPYQKLIGNAAKSNSDCEDFAFAALGLYHHLCSGEFRYTGTDALARFLARYIPLAYSRGMVATGYVTPSVARPDQPTTTADISGHGFVVLHRTPRLFPKSRIRWIVVECTALTLSYCPMRPPDPEESLTAMCAREFGGMMRLELPDPRLSKLRTSIGHAVLVGLNREGFPFKYKTIATLSDDQMGYAVTQQDGLTVGVDMATFVCGGGRYVPISSKTDVYDKYLRGFQINPRNVCEALGISNSKCPDGGGMRGVVAYTEHDDTPPRDIKQVRIPIAFGTVVLAGLASTEGNVGHHHNVPLRVGPQRPPPSPHVMPLSHVRASF